MRARGHKKKNFCRSAESGQRGGDYFAIDQRQRPTLGIVNDHRVIDTQQMIHRGQHVLGADRMIGHVAAMLVRGSHDAAAGHAAAGHQCRIDARPMIATAPFDVGDMGRATMLAGANNQRFVQQTPPVEVA